MSSLDNSMSRKRRGQFLESVRSKIIRHFQPKTKGGKQLQELLLKDDCTYAFLDKTMQQLRDQEYVFKARQNVLPVSKNWERKDEEEADNFLRKLRNVKEDKDEIWKALIGGEVKMYGNEHVLHHYRKYGFEQSAAAWSRNPEEIMPQLQSSVGTKVPSYTAFSGASGAGKTCSMLWVLHKIILKHMDQDINCLKYYISCNPLPTQSLFEYVIDCIKTPMNELLRYHHHDWDDFQSQRKQTWLVLLLDEVQSRFDHKSYHSLPGMLTEDFGFGKVVLLVGSTAISQDVNRQPTASNEVLNIRMKPLEKNTMKLLLTHHLRQLKPQIQSSKLGSIVDQLFHEMPVLWNLMSNHRCAFLAAIVISELLGSNPMEEIPCGWGQGHSTTLVTMVACKYREQNGLSRDPTESRRLMLESLALLAGQKLVKEGEGVDRVPKECSLPLLAKKVVEIGLVERAVLPDEILEDSKKVKVDGSYEFQMSPALTLICATAILPSLEGNFNAADHFEALVAILMVAMRYAQTSTVFPIRQLARGVPYSGNEEHKFYQPSVSVDECCFINGPQESYSDLIVAGVPKGFECPNASLLAETIRKEKGVLSFPAHPLLVQCKQTSTEFAECDFVSEYAKMGFFKKPEKSEDDMKMSSVHHEVVSPEENPFESTSKLHKRYSSGRWLTNVWVKKGNDEEQVDIAFATNKRFADSSADVSVGAVRLMEADGDKEHAWEKLYPIIDLVRKEEKYPYVGRKRVNI